MNTATKTYTPKASEIQRHWRVIDAAGKPLGRLASEVAQILKGKDKPTYTPHMDTGDFVIVVNASRVVVTGNKASRKVYYTHSMYPGGLKAITFDKMMARHPRRIIERAVWGMLPKNRLGRALYRKLKVYAEGTHPHGAQAEEFAAPEKPGRAGNPRPPKKLRVRKERPAVAELPAEETPPVEEPVEVTAEAPAVEAAPVAALEPPIEELAAEAPAGEPEAVEAAPAAADPAELDPITPAPRRPRSRSARAREATESSTASTEEQAAPEAVTAPVEDSSVEEKTPPPRRSRSRAPRPQAEGTPADGAEDRRG